ncbi:hypothetical protein CICLE_v10018311mg [Citrus x clementina]|uniref:Uncharacterized protein n=1 Tax=Citrus clementina TaxID=85681 RepID=V4W1R0_CITCL|nr:transcription factor MYB58 [Citrus x clementina]ESR59829.1 hypothetical protein CICLE_v10018311mg [Citrus x clementina]
MVRAPTYDEKGMKRGAWSKEEDDKLRAYILRYGHWNWTQLPKFAGLSRSGKSCRLRWMNYLRPDIKHGNYTKEEEDTIIKTRQQHGNKWALIAAKLPGRTDNEIKNYWHTHLKKKIDKKTDSADQEHEETSQSDQAERQEINLAATTSSSDHHHHAVGSPVNSLCEDISTRDFWTQPFVSDSENDYYSLSSDSCYEYTIDIFDPVMQELQAFDVDFSS